MDTCDVASDVPQENGARRRRVGVLRDVYSSLTEPVERQSASTRARTEIVHRLADQLLWLCDTLSSDCEEHTRKSVRRYARSLLPLGRTKRHSLGTRIKRNIFLPCNQSLVR